MEVTIMIAPKGCTRNPVAFKPSVHVFTVPEGVDVDDFLERVVDGLSMSYHNGVYFCKVRGREFDVDDFRDYVMYREKRRCEQERCENIKLAYDEVVGIFVGNGAFSDRWGRFKHLLRRIIPGISNTFCRWILCQSATATGYVDLQGFSEVISAAEKEWTMVKVVRV